MPFIETILPEHAAGIMQQIYADAKERVGYVANIIRVMSLEGRIAQSSMQFYGTLMKRPNALTTSQREMLAVVVSNANDCYY